MKTLRNVWVILALLSSVNAFAGSVGESSSAECTESVQSGRYEGGDVAVDESSTKTDKSESSSTSR